MIFTLTHRSVDWFELFRVALFFYDNINHWLMLIKDSGPQKWWSGENEAKFDSYP